MTNFDMSRYDVKAILESNTLPIGGGAAKRLKEAQALESTRRREEMIALGSNFSSYGSSAGTSRLQAYPLIQTTPYDHHPQPLLTLQNQDISQYSSDPNSSFHQSYIQTQLQLQQQPSGASNYLPQATNQNSNFYNSYIQSNPGLLHGLVNMSGGSGSSSNNNNFMENNGSSGGSYSTGGGYIGNNGINMVTNSSGGSHAEELPLVKVDYDMQSGGYGGSWSGDSVQGTNPGMFTMWND